MRGVLVGWWLTPAALFMGAEQSSFEQGDALRVGKHTHYAILGLDANNFDEKALKKHYRALALKWHPDRNIGNESVAAEKFKSVQEAFDTLSDPTKRAAYDQAVLAKKHGGSERDRDPNSRSAHSSIKELKARCPPHVNTSGMEKKELVQLVLEAVTEAAETPPQDRGTSSSSSSSPSSSIPGPEASHVALTAEQQVRVQPSELSSTPPPPCFQMIDDPCPYVARR